MFSVSFLFHSKSRTDGNPILICACTMKTTQLVAYITLFVITLVLATPIRRNAENASTPAASQVEAPASTASPSTVTAMNSTTEGKPGAAATEPSSTTVTTTEVPVTSTSKKPAPLNISSTVSVSTTASPTSPAPSPASTLKAPPPTPTQKNELPANLPGGIANALAALEAVKKL